MVIYGRTSEHDMLFSKNKGHFLLPLLLSGKTRFGDAGVVEDEVCSFRVICLSVEIRLDCLRIPLECDDEEGKRLEVLSCFFAVSLSFISSYFDTGDTEHLWLPECAREY